MNRFLKTIALILAMLMLVTMATACKKTDDEIDSFLSNNSTIGGSEIQGEDNDLQPNDPATDGGDPDINGTENSDPGTDKESQGTNKPDTNPNKPEEPADPNGSGADEHPILFKHIGVSRLRVGNDLLRSVQVIEERHLVFGAVGVHLNQSSADQPGKLCLIPQLKITDDHGYVPPFSFSASILPCTLNFV